jgi:hypothetical protein
VARRPLGLSCSATLSGGAANDFDDARGVARLQLFPVDHGQIFNAGPWLGKRVIVTGKISATLIATDAATAQYIDVLGIRSAP